MQPILAQVGNGRGWCTAYANKAAKLHEEARDQYGNDGTKFGIDAFEWWLLMRGEERIARPKP